MVFAILPLPVCFRAEETIEQISPQQQAASESKSEIIDCRGKAQPPQSDFQHLARQCSLMLPECSVQPSMNVSHGGLENHENLLMQMQMKFFQEAWLHTVR